MRPRRCSTSLFVLYFGVHRRGGRPHPDRRRSRQGNRRLQSDQKVESSAQSDRACLQSRVLGQWVNIVLFVFSFLFFLIVFFTLGFAAFATAFATKTKF